MTPPEPHQQGAHCDAADQIPEDEQLAVVPIPGLELDQVGDQKDQAERRDQQAVTTPRTTRLWTWMSGSSPVSAPATRKATASFLIVHRRHDCRTAVRVARQSKNGVCSNGGVSSSSTAMTTAAPKTNDRWG